MARILQEDKKRPLAKLCRLAGVSRQSVYQREKRLSEKQDKLEPVLPLVRDVRRILPRIGTRKLHHLLKPKLEQSGIKLGRDKLFDFLRERHMLVAPRRSYTKTTKSKHWMKKHPNLFAEMELNRPEQAFVSDITYVRSDEGIHYLSLVTDAYSRKIMGYELSHEMKATDTVKALQLAVKERVYDGELVHHSDRGSQYCSGLYQEVLSKAQITPSMTDGYDCYQNALAERINGILKHEFLIHRYSSFEELKQVIEESIKIYNSYRPHLSLGMRTPNEVHEKASCKSNWLH